MKKQDFSTAYWGNNVPDLMRIHGLTAEDLAVAMDMSVQAVYDLKKKGVISLTAQRAAQLQSVFKTDYHKIFPLEVPPKPLDTENVAEVEARQ